MHYSDIVDDQQASYSGLATFEIWLGVFLVTIPLARILLNKLGAGFELGGLYVLAPFLVIMSGALLTMAGGLLRRLPQRPFICHLPLALWAVFLIAVFL